MKTITGKVTGKYISGKYISDENFITVFSGNALYDIAKKTGEWGFLKVGERSAIGPVLTQEAYDKMLSECTREGTFELK